MISNSNENAIRVAVATESMIIKLAISTNIIACAPQHDVYSKQFIKLLRNNSKSYSIAYMKTCRTILYKYVAGNTVNSFTGVRLTKDGIPCFLGNWIPLIRKKDEGAIRVVLSLFTIGRLFTGVGKLKLDTIVNAYTGTEISKVISVSDIKSFVLDITNESTPKLSDIPNKFYVRSSTGPTGPAMTSIIKEAKDLPDELHATLVRLLSPEITKVMQECREEHVLTDPDYLHLMSSSNIIRKITVVEDKEGKDRVIAIFDYWSQLALKPLHEWLMQLIRGIEQDATYNQTGRIDELVKLGGPYYSLDLKAATDRMPSKLQMDLLTVLLQDREKAKDFFSVLNDYPFSTRDGKSVKYAVGQPMGAYSSWALMALTHHLIVRSAMRRTNSNPNQYVLLGDDLVIQGDDFAKAYKDIISALGMEISPFKTIESKDSFEFAKRFYVNSKEMTPLPIGQLKHAMSQYWDIVGFIVQSEDRGWNFDTHKARVLLCSYLFKNDPKRKRQYLTNKVNDYYYMIDCYRDKWDEQLDENIPKWILPSKFNFGCTRSKDFVRQYILELYIHVTMEMIHSNIVKQVKGYNKFANNKHNRMFKAKHDTYHPLVSILHACAEGLRELEYKASSDPIKETKAYYRSKVDVKKFTFIPADLTKVLSLSGHSVGQKCRVILNDKLRELVLQLDIKRGVELASVSDDKETGEDEQTSS